MRWPRLTRCQQHPPPGRDNQTCLQTLPNVPWGGKELPFENCCSRVTNNPVCGRQRGFRNKRLAVLKPGNSWQNGTSWSPTLPPSHFHLPTNRISSSALRAEKGSFTVLYGTTSHTPTNITPHPIAASVANVLPLSPPSPAAIPSTMTSTRLSQPLTKWLTYFLGY